MAAKYKGGFEYESEKYGGGEVTEDDIRKWSKADGENNAFDKLAASLGVDTGSGKNKKKEMRQVYEEIYGDGTADDLSKKELKKALANYMNSQYMVENTREMAKNFENRSDSKKKID